MKANIEYDIHTGELCIVFKKVEVPMVYQLDNNVVLEFDDDQLCAIVLPDFERMFNRGSLVGCTFDLNNIEIVDDDMMISLLCNKETTSSFNINVNVNISSIK